MYSKVLFTASSFGHIRSFHIPYLSAFQQAGATVHVACGGDLCELPGADCLIPVPFEKKIYSPKNIHVAHILHRLMQKEAYDLVITHTSLAAFFTRLAISRLKSHPRTIYMCHGYLFDDKSATIRREVLLTAERLVARQTDLLLNMNAYDYRLALRCHLGKKIALIPGLGVDYRKLDVSGIAARKELRQRFGVPQDAFVLFYAAEFSRRKNQEFLIRSMARLPRSVYLVLAGNGELWTFCKQSAEKHGVSARVLFPGHVSPVSDWYLMADAAVSASRSEGLPFNIMEAMHFGLPIVASDVKGNSDLIQTGVNGLLYPYEDEVSYTILIKQLLDRPDLGGQLGKAAFLSSQQYALPTVFPTVWSHYTDTGNDAEL